MHLACFDNLLRALFHSNWLLLVMWVLACCSDLHGLKMLIAAFLIMPDPFWMSQLKLSIVTCWFLMQSSLLAFCCASPVLELLIPHQAASVVSLSRPVKYLISQDAPLDGTEVITRSQPYVNYLAAWLIIQVIVSVQRALHRDIHVRTVVDCWNLGNQAYALPAPESYSMNDSSAIEISHIIILLKISILLMESLKASAIWYLERV